MKVKKIGEVFKNLGSFFFGAHTDSTVWKYVWPSNRCLRGMQYFAGFKIDIYDPQF